MGSGGALEGLYRLLRMPFKAPAPPPQSPPNLDPSLTPPLLTVVVMRISAEGGAGLGFI